MKVLVLNESKKKSEQILKTIENFKETIADLKSNSKIVFNDFFTKYVESCRKAIEVNKLDTKIKLKASLDSISIKSDGLELFGKNPKKIIITINGHNYEFKYDKTLSSKSSEAIAKAILDKIVENPESLNDKVDTKYWLTRNLQFCINKYLSCLSSIIHYLKDIEKYQKKYEEQLEKEKEAEEKAKEKSQAFKNSLPQCLISLMNKLIKEKDEYDFRIKDLLLKKYDELGKEKFFKAYGQSGFNVALIGYSNEYIHEINVSDSELLIKQLIAKTKSVTGNIIKVEGITIAPGNTGVSLNGRVIGEKGQCDIESIYAGGYNIQKEHVRVVLKNKKKF